MSARRGASLVELMVALAVLGISASIMGSATGMIRSWSAEVVLRERALQVLEAEARAWMNGRDGAQPEVRERLLEELPQGRLETSPSSAGTVQLTVHWRAATRGTSSRMLVVWPLGAVR